MSILVGKDTRLVVQGITGREGMFHTQQMIEYGTEIVAGVSPGKGGEWVHGVPVFDTAKEAVNTTGANTSIVYVPAPAAPDAIMEAADAGIKLIVCITEGIPILDMVRVRHFLDEKKALLVGPNSPGIITPGQAKVGIMPGHIHSRGSIGIVSRSGTLTYEIVQALANRNLGQSTTIGIGGDPIIGISFADVLRFFESDPATEHVVLIGEIGGTDEEQAAKFIASKMTKPVTAFIAGRTAPPDKRMGHAGAIITAGSGTAQEKVTALEAVGVRVASHPSEVADLVAERMSNDR
jgi:succinyl-CoA synthetase alpha subunit